MGIFFWGGGCFHFQYDNLFISFLINYYYNEAKGIRTLGKKIHNLLLYYSNNIFIIHVKKTIDLSLWDEEIIKILFNKIIEKFDNFPE